MTPESRKRLTTLEEFSDLGDGFKVAMKDLEIRGAGNLLGGEQSGFINDLGIEMYHKILDDTVQELKENEFKSLFENDLKEVAETLKSGFVKDCNIETDLEILIPENYVESISERLRLYTDLDNIKDEEGLESFRKEVVDRFGELPNEVKGLIKSVRLRWDAINLGFEKVSLKNETARCYFITSKDEYFKSPQFAAVLNYAQRNPKNCKLKETANKFLFIIDEIEDIDQLKSSFEEILDKTKQ